MGGQGWLAQSRLTHIGHASQSQIDSMLELSWVHQLAPYCSLTGMNNAPSMHPVLMIRM
jgi:hypothetical protein